MKIDYLGHIVSSGRVAPDPAKVKAVLDWPIPKNVKALQGFLGLSGFYRRFKWGYAAIAQPLTALLKKDSFKWFVEAQFSLEKLKNAVAQAPVLALPNFSKPFILQTDASGHAMGAVLL